MNEYRRIGRMIVGTPPLPTWRTNMPNTNTLYEVGDTPSVVLPGRIQWPATGAGNSLYAGSDSNTLFMHYGYGSTIYDPTMGPFGGFICGGTGESTIQEQLTMFDLSSNQPTWDFFQQPMYPTTEGEAIAMDADAYYNEADYNNRTLIPAQRVIGYGSDYLFTPGWDDVFPCGYANWVIRRKLQKSWVGNQRPWMFRYEMPCWVPASMTGTGSPAIIVNNRAWSGPFLGTKPGGGMADSRWYDAADLWPSGTHKHHFYVMNTTTKAWTRLATPIPEMIPYPGDVFVPFSAVDVANKKVWYYDYNANGGSVVSILYSIDLSAGFAGLSSVQVDTLTDLAGGAASSQLSNHIFVVPPAGMNAAGRRLIFSKESHVIPALLLVDVDNLTISRLRITGLPSTTGAIWSLGYDSDLNRIVITIRYTDHTFASIIIPIPSDPTNAANYATCVVTPLAFAAGVTPEAIAPAPWQYGGRGLVVPNLGVVFSTQRTNKMLAYRPA